MCTGHQDAHTVQTSRKMGAVAYLPKPFSQYLLREALDQAPGEEPAVDEQHVDRHRRHRANRGRALPSSKTAEPYLICTCT